MKNTSDRAEAGAVAERRVLMIAGEASGDVYASELVEALRRLDPTVTVSGIGGSHSRSAGVDVWIDMAEINTMGLTEVAAKSRGIFHAYRRIRRVLIDTPPRLVIFIDFPEFNLALAAIARRRGIPVFYYVSPQVWAWRRGRIRKILRRVDRLAVVFPFELEVYRNSPKVTYVGHPLIDHVRVTVSPVETCRRHGLDPERPLVVLLPGSRARELERLLPAMAGAVGLIAAQRDAQFACALAPTVSRATAERIISRVPTPIPLIEDDTYNLIHAADLAVATSGTVTLETALLERPLIVLYRASRLTWTAARMIVNVPAIGMPNLIAGRKIVPELLQNEATPMRIAEEVGTILDDPGRAAEMRRELAVVREALGPGGAAGRAAALALELLR